MIPVLLFLFLQIASAQECISLNVTTQEFYASYARIFQLSDGSSLLQPSASASSQDAAKYTQQLLHAVGVSSSLSGNTIAMNACGKDAMDILLLAAVGNLVSNPSDMNPVGTPTIVMDAYTGKLAVYMPYDTVRGYFVEALLIISILVITRLSFVRNITYNVTPKA